MEREGEVMVGWGGGDGEKGKKRVKLKKKRIKWNPGGDRKRERINFGEQKKGLMLGEEDKEAKKKKKVNSNTD